MYKNGVNFFIIIDNYINLLNVAIKTSIKNTEFFKKLILNK